VVNPRKWKKEAKPITMYSKYNSPMTMYQRELVTDSEPVPIEELTKVHVDTTPLREEELWI
jgi:hypothetical protein